MLCTSFFISFSEGNILFRPSALFEYSILEPNIVCFPKYVRNSIKHMRLWKNLWLWPTTCRRRTFSFFFAPWYPLNLYVYQLILALIKILILNFLFVFLTLSIDRNVLLKIKYRLYSKATEASISISYLWFIFV